MANKTIGQLTEATSVQTTDLFLLEQTGTAKKLTGQTLINDLADALDGHGGIVSIAKTSTSGLVDTYTITLADGTTATFSVKNGENGTDGTNGTDGADGFSPTIASSTISGGHRLTITDVNGTRTVNVMDGTNGTNGTNGTDGKDGTNGTNGTDGKDGTTFTPSVSAEGVISWTNDGGKSNPPSVNIHGEDGTDGVDGVTFTPTVSAEGVISWTNDGGRVNPSSVNIKGEQGAQGDNWFVYIKWASAQPTADSDMGDIPDAWMGVYGGASATAPTHYTDYAWYEVKGEKGDDGDPITAVVRTGGDGSPGTDDTYTVYVNSTVVGTFIIHNGVDGIGTVNSINGIGVSSGTNNVVLTAVDVGAAAIPLHLQATATSLPLTINNSAITATMRVIECTFGTPTAVSSDITWTTSDGSIVLSGTMSGSTTVDLVLIETT